MNPSNSRKYPTSGDATLSSLSAVQAWLFDLDGVLTPTADVHMRAWARLFEPLLDAYRALPYTDADYFAHIDGKPRYDGVRSLLASRGIELPDGSPDDSPDTDSVCGLGNRKNIAFTSTLAEEGVAPYPASAAFLDAIEHAGLLARGRLELEERSRGARRCRARRSVRRRRRRRIRRGRMAFPASPPPTPTSAPPSCSACRRPRCAVVEDAESGVQAGAAGAFASRHRHRPRRRPRCPDAARRRRRGRRARRTDPPHQQRGQRMRFVDTDPLNRTRFPIDEWALVETEFDAADQGRTETLFAVGNGYLGLRGNVEEGRDGHAHGTFVNGFHETWPIRHAEDAFGFARVGQTIVNAPDAKTIRLYVDDEPLVLTEAEILAYERRLDFRAGVLRRSIEWRTPAGKHVRISSRRMTSFIDRHLAVIDYEVELLDADAAVTITSHILNRQDGRDEYRAKSAARARRSTRARRRRSPSACSSRASEGGRRALHARLPDDELGHDARSRRRARHRDRQPLHRDRHDRRRPGEARRPCPGEAAARPSGSRSS